MPPPASFLGGPGCTKKEKSQTLKPRIKANAVLPSILQCKKTLQEHKELCNKCISKSLYKAVDLLESYNLLSISAHCLNFYTSRPEVSVQLPHFMQLQIKTVHFALDENVFL